MAYGLKASSCHPLKEFSLMSSTFNWLHCKDNGGIALSFWSKFKYSNLGRVLMLKELKPINPLPSRYKYNCRFSKEARSWFSIVMSLLRHNFNVVRLFNVSNIEFDNSDNKLPGTLSVISLVTGLKTPSVKIWSLLPSRARCINPRVALKILMRNTLISLFYRSKYFNIFKPVKIDAGRLDRELSFNLKTVTDRITLQTDKL